MATKESTAAHPADPGAAERMVVARFLDGRTLKGTTHDFSPTKPTFHIYKEGDESSTAIAVEVEELKAVFYVRSYLGACEHQSAYDFDRARGYGRKVAVMFHDGEFIAGYVMGYKPESRGFFLFPADPEGNNSRIYIVNRAVSKVKWL